MNKKLRRVISALLALCLLACMIIPAASAMPQESADGSIKRISVVINGDAKTRRGICWYTAEKCGSDVEVMPLAKYSGSFDGALKFPTPARSGRRTTATRCSPRDLSPEPNMFTESATPRPESGATTARLRQPATAKRRFRL